jgi:hypothetical protein
MDSNRQDGIRIAVPTDSADRIRGLVVDFRDGTIGRGFAFGQLEERSPSKLGPHKGTTLPVPRADASRAPVLSTCGVLLSFATVRYALHMAKRLGWYLPEQLILKITLLGSKPVIWRRVEVHSGLTLHELHIVIQCVFEWDGSHLYHFLVPPGGKLTRRAMAEARRYHMLPPDPVFGEDEAKIVPPTSPWWAR